MICVFNTAISYAAGGAGAPGARDCVCAAQTTGNFATNSLGRLASCVASVSEVGLVHALGALGEAVGPDLIRAFLGDVRDSLGVTGLRRDLLGLGPVELQQVLDRTTVFGRRTEDTELRQRERDHSEHRDADGEPPPAIEFHRSNFNRRSTINTRATMRTRPRNRNIGYCQ